MRFLFQATCRVASRALITSASRPSVALRRPFSSCIPTVVRPKLAISSLGRMRTYATQPDEDDPEHDFAGNAKRPNRDDDPPPSNRLYVGNLPFETTEDTVAQEFSKFGSVQSVDMPRAGGDKGLRRGIAYVAFESLEQATAAQAAMHNQVLEGRMMNVEYARQPRISKRIIFKQNAPSRTLYIGNMSHDMDDQDLNELFRDVPGVMDVRVAIDRRTGKARGFAHADFTTVEHATHASEVISNSVYYGRRLRVDFSQNTSDRFRANPRQQKTEQVEEEGQNEGQSRDA